MILWLSVIAAAVTVAVASARMVRRHHDHVPRRGRDPHWGDWPPDQMAP